MNIPFERRLTPTDLSLLGGMKIAQPLGDVVKTERPLRRELLAELDAAAVEPAPLCDDVTLKQVAGAMVPFSVFEQQDAYGRRLEAQLLTERAAHQRALANLRLQYVCELRQQKEASEERYRAVTSWLGLGLGLALAALGSSLWGGWRP